MGKTEFAESFDGAKIAYQVYGEGDLTIFLSNGIGCHRVFMQYLIDDLSKHYRVIFWHYRGHMESPPPPSPKDWTMDMNILDMLAVMRKTGTKQAVLGGFSMGVQINLEFYRRYPDRVLGIMNLCGPYEYALRTFYYIGPVWTKTMPLVHKLVKTIPGISKKVWSVVLEGPWAFTVAGWVIYNPDRMQRKDFDLYRPHFVNINLDQFIQGALYLNEHSAADVLPDIDVPTLIVAGTNDNFTPLRVNRVMHRLIPGSEILEVEGGTHATLLEFPDVVNPRVMSFLKKHFGRKDEIKPSGEKAAAS